jgi:hypothetical protein
MAFFRAVRVTFALIHPHMGLPSLWFSAFDTPAIHKLFQDAQKRL